MGLGCGATMIKYLLFLLNFIFFICGAGILGVAIWLQVDDDASNYLSIIEDADSNPVIEIAFYLMTAVGVFIFLVGFLGCCGACKESSCMLCMYAFLVSLILVLQIAGAIVAIIFKSELDSELEDGMSEQANEHVNGVEDDDVTKAWDKMQFDLKCCGGKNFVDYENSLFWNETGNKEDPNTNLYVPLTCCKQAADSTWKEPIPENQAKCMEEAKTYVYDPANPPEFLNGEGCYTGIKDWLSDKSDILIGVGFGLGAFQVLCVLFACCVRGKIKEREGYE